MSKSNTDRDVCPVFASSGKCGEQDALDVMEQFRSFYENKLNEIDHQGGGDCLELKLKVQRRWIDDLTEQTQMMARIVKELEDEATNRVRMLEDKLRQTSKSAYEVMKRYQNYSITHNLDEPFQKVFYLENDLKNLLEFIRRIREDRKWSIDGLQFYDITYKDLFGKEQYDSNDNKERNLVPVASKDANKRKVGKKTLKLILQVVDKRNKQNIKDKCRCRHNSPKRAISPCNPCRCCPALLEHRPRRKPSNESVDENENNKCGDVFEQLKRKTIEYEALRQSMLDMRSALTEEVACKHDMISALKKDIQQLEERCVQADKQTAFKDDIIKELRKEIKQLKQQICPEFPLKKWKSRDKTVLTTIRHNRTCEKPKYSTVIFINDESKKSERKDLNLCKTESVPSYLTEESSTFGNGKFSEFGKILEQVKCLKSKMKQFYERHKLSLTKIKELEEDNNSKSLLLMSLYNIIKGLLSKLTFTENIEIRNDFLTKQNKSLVFDNTKILRNLYNAELSKLNEDCERGNEIIKLMDVNFANTVLMNNDNEASLRKQLDEAHQLIKRMKPCVDVTTTFTDMDNTSAARRREKDLEDEIERRQREVNELKTKCVDLEKCLASSQGCAANLQKAVDLYLNSINVLEASEERARIEIEQQKVTIANLQQALVCVKHELDELRQNNQQEVSLGWAARWFGSSNPGPKPNHVTKPVHDI
ncbi:hypothetical protein TcasGA2_TC033262 [Tribolium castaneum]|uniref:Uncharacterized protein n=1 Tax=Tribolium castaneum TaxID=7070 RepID=A0A139WI07_TRICA|nr:hypothetical protein TcasGA2_TC033262 [Tribolium castaneum]